MYQVKGNGRDGVLLYDTSFNQELQRKFTIQNELKLAIEKKELEVYYQPVYDMQTGLIVGAEALARWNHKKLGFIPPDEFIKVAEDSGSIISLGALIQDIVFHDLQTIRNFISLDNFTMAINVSSREFFHNDFIEQLVQKTEDFFLTNSNIELEITETHIMKNHELAIGKFKQLKEHGFKLAIDDFGTGYSSLSYLKDFPIDKLKIDQSFIFTITQNDDDLKIVKAIIYLAKGFSLQTQAEGVETQEHVELLKKLGCDIAQGYHFSKPLVFQDFLERLKETK
jgi:EAL domain-containing protein (putative c-di-GMP-specific phosphodiesterase class I)